MSETVPLRRTLAGERPAESPVALVTGAGRRRGIGTAICRALAHRGVDVFFTYWRGYDRDVSRNLDEDGPDVLLEDLRCAGVRAEGAESDLSLPESPGRLLDAVAGRLGAPSILVNNAAYSTRDGVEGLDAETLDAHYAVNLRAAALLCVGFARRYPGGPGGRIINLTSGQSLGPMPNEIAYAATKGAIEALTVTLAAEVGHLGITVNAVNPGPTDTGWMKEDLRRELSTRFPAGRVGEPEDAARLVAFLASDEARWITGQILHSEGGFLRS
ncbi:MAG: SDR family oxidoreductase [Actinomycetota bacterium]|nr:SDR family oxidoreductase [Actinomycetota bacterium]